MPKCDKCGRFMREEPGSSWVMVPSTDWNSGDERTRCKSCTEKYGKCMAWGNYVEHLVSGINGESR